MQVSFAIAYPLSIGIDPFVLNSDTQYTLAETERAGIDVTRRDFLYFLLGKKLYHQYFAHLNSEKRLLLLSRGTEA